MGAISLYQAHDCPITPRKKETNGSAGTGAQILVKTDHRGSSQGGYGKFIRYKRALPGPHTSASPKTSAIE